MSKKQTTILVVEDDAITRMSIVNALKKIYSLVLEASDGEHAKDLLRQNGIDILITDINLPNYSGADIIDYVVDDKKIKTIPIVIITGYHELACQYKNQKCISILLKPFQIDNLIKEIDKALGSIYTSTCVTNIKQINCKVNQLLDMMK